MIGNHSVVRSGMLVSANGQIESGAQRCVAIVLVELSDQSRVVCRGDHNGNHRAREESLVLASEKGYIRTVRWLMRGGADIHTENNKALRFASKNGHLEVVQFLVEGGADVCK